MPTDFLMLHLEALVFCSGKPISEKELLGCVSEMFGAKVPESDVEENLKKIKQKYDDGAYSFTLVKSGGGYQFLTKPAYQASIGILLKQQSKKRLSNSALETLAIIAYKQPIIKSRIEQIRGVNCDYALRRLLEKELLEIKGRSEAVGRPVLYGTSRKFMDYMGINDLKELPTPKDFKTEDNSIGTQKE